ncbi:MAG: DUF2809 domain-containing protein [Verrucomicrobiales bacterium]|nr:DUF2809 domain-containing protein [Verrucomicrobiales bacterium]
MNLLPSAVTTAPAGARERNRLTTGALLAVVIATGLFSRSALAERLPAFIVTYAGDTLWAVALFLFIGFVRPGIPTGTAACVTVAIAFAVEFSQLYQADWIRTIRHNRIGALLLGNGFLGSDLVCYTVGCLLGVMVDAGRGSCLWLKQRRKDATA